MNSAGLDEATRWFLQLQESDLSLETLEAWRVWVSAPENRDRFDRVERVWSALGRAPRPEVPSVEEAAAPGYDGNRSLAQWRAQRAAGFFHKQKPRRYLRYGLAAGVTLAALASAWIAYRDVPARSGEVSVFETAVAEHRDVRLSDGSRIELAARTAVTTSLNVQARTVVLNNGEAHFDVARDPRRPFQVIAGGGTITAIGTAFNVRRRDDDHVVVTVTDGAVRIAPLNARDGFGRVSEVKQLRKGEQVIYDAEGRFEETSRLDGQLAPSWRDGRLEYRRESLRNVLSDVNRYSSRQIVLGDSMAGDLPFTGTVFERDIDEWIAVLHRTYPQLEITGMESEKILIRSRR